MLNEYLPDHLLREELAKRDYVFQSLVRGNEFQGREIEIPLVYS